MADRFRYAPSPTGSLHLGNARTALLAWLQARAAGGVFVLRIEDLDRARCQPGGAAQMLEDLRWLGLDWDEGPDLGGPFGPYVQSEREQRYAAAVQTLLDRGLAFRCYCSRKEVARAASAPNDVSDEGPRYPGTCRGLDADEQLRRAAARPPAVRFRVEGGEVTFEDGLHGSFRQDVSASAGDFVIHRSDGVAAYQLAVVVDDAAMGITQVLRGEDLLASTPRQLLLFRALGLPEPRFTHVPLLLDASGERMAKRKGSETLAARRAAGDRPEQLVGLLAHSAGLIDRPQLMAARELVKGFAIRRLKLDARGPVSPPLSPV